jgi:hypothetical protein
MMRDERQINIDEGVSPRESLPGRRNTAVAVDDPFVLTQQLCVGFQVFFVRSFAAASPIFDEIERIVRQPCQLR